jgi:hypothetical protein
MTSSCLWDAQGMMRCPKTTNTTTSTNGIESFQDLPVPTPARCMECGVKDDILACKCMNANNQYNYSIIKWQVCKSNNKPIINDYGTLSCP